jgi:hypothetical protein
MPTGYWWWGFEAKGKLGRPSLRWEYDIKCSRNTMGDCGCANLQQDTDKK